MRVLPWALLIFFGIGLPAPRAAGAASIAAIACPAEKGGRSVGSATPARCDYASAPGFHPTHDGGPWVNVDLLRVKYSELKAIHDGQPQVPLFKGGPPRPPLGLVHAQICLSDPDVPYNACPNDYPYNPANAGLGYRLNPKITPRLAAGLDAVRRAGLKVILRFTYNWPCPAKGNRCYFGMERDAPLDVILEHMRELAPVVQQNADVIYALQAGFIGRWGEWHNSYHGEGTQYDNGRQSAHDRFLDRYTALFAPYVRLEVRDPYQLLDYADWRFGVHDPAHVLALGIGLHDDAYGADPTDAGTYLPQQLVNNPRPTHYENCELRRTLLLVAREYPLTAEASMIYRFDGTKPCKEETYSNIVDYSQQSRLATFQLGFDAVLASWRHAYYDAMLQTAGPHLALVSAAVSARGSKPQTLRLTIRNTGWSAISGSRALWLVVASENASVLEERLPVDLSQIQPGESLTVSAPLALPARLAGTFDLKLFAPDPAPRLFFDPLYALLFENPNVPDARTGKNVIARIAVVR